MPISNLFHVFYLHPRISACTALVTVGKGTSSFNSYEYVKWCAVLCLRAPLTPPHFLPSLLCAVLPQERLTHSLLPFTHAETVRHLSYFLRWTNAQRFSLSNTRFRSFTHPIFQFEATSPHTTLSSRPRSTTAAFARSLPSAKFIFQACHSGHQWPHL
jgi:hypothetical protein